MKKEKVVACAALSTLLAVGGVIILSSGVGNSFASKLIGSSSTKEYSILLDKNNAATVAEVGTYNDSSSETNLGTRQTKLGNDIQFQFCSGRGVTNNDGSNPATKFCQMPGNNYGWVTNLNPLHGVTKLKVSVSQASAVFRVDFSDDHTLENYYYSVDKPEYVKYRTSEYTGSNTYEIDFTGSYHYFRFQNLGSSHLSLVSLEIVYTCDYTPSYRGYLYKNASAPISLSKPYTVSEGGTLVVDYRFVDPVTDEKNGVSLFFGSDETNRFGNYKIFFDHLETTYNGVTFTPLNDGYYRMTIDVSKLDQVRSGEVAPTTISQISFRWFEATQGVYFDVNPQDKKEKPTEFTMKGSEFVIANFTDIHVTDESLLSDTGTTGKTIKYGIKNSNPDIMLFSGDIAGKAADLDYICNYLDGFKIPYFIILGNHDHEGSLGYDAIAQRVDQSDYGYIEKGPESLGSQGNYTIKIKNSSGNLVHGFVMMDTGNKYTITDYDSVEYFAGTMVSGVKYGSFNSKTTYCDGTSGAGNAWDGIRGNQITWFSETAETLNCETTLVCHAGFNEYVKAYEQYQDAVNKQDQTKIDACKPIGKCTMGEQCCGTVEKTGLFDAIKKAGTKNVICGHDHLNDFSLLYDGVRLTYALKTGEGSYWLTSGERNGYTELTIDSSGATTLDQIYFNPLNN